MTDQNAPYPGPDAQNAPRFVAQASAESTTTVAPQHGIGPYTLREWIVLGAAALLLILSFFSRALGSTFIGYAPIWTLGVAWVPAVVLPLLSAALIALRRTNNVTNFGSLSVDQLASVSFVGAAITWLHVIVTLGSLASWTAWVALVVSLAGVFFTVFARFVAPFSEDFTGREAVVAHVAARPVRPVIAAPRPVAPAAAAPATAYGAAQPNPYGAPAPQQADPFQAPAAAADPFPSDPFQASATATGGVDRFAAPAAQADSASESASASEVETEQAPASDNAYPATQVVGTVEAELLEADEAPAADEASASVDAADELVAQPADEPVSQPVVDEPAAQATAPAASHQPFWALVPEERDVHDFEGHAIYKIGPTAWALVLEDRGTYFVMRHDDGRVGYLHNIEGVTRS